MNRNKDSLINHLFIFFMRLNRETQTEKETNSRPVFLTGWLSIDQIFNIHHIQWWSTLIKLVLYLFLFKKQLIVNLLWERYKCEWAKHCKRYNVQVQARFMMMIAPYPLLATPKGVIVILHKIFVMCFCASCSCPHLLVIFFFQNFKCFLFFD